MRLRISHTTTYDYDEPVPYALQQLRLTPKSHAAQNVLSWTTTIDGGQKQLSFEDMHRNTVDLISFDTDVTRVSVTCEGEVEVRETHGVHGPHGGFMPLWMFERSTPLTKPGPMIRKLANQVEDSDEVLPRLHDLMRSIHAAVDYVPGSSDATSTAEEALTEGKGVCQDHAHIFISAARHLDIPARYVSGYLMMEDRVEQDATHAWAEAHVPGLGWVGFDPANKVCPDQRYVRVATGLDYAEAAPVSGMRFGDAGERLAVHVQVQQQ